METNIYCLGCRVNELIDTPWLLSRRLTELGYSNGYTGKWHLGIGKNIVMDHEYSTASRVSSEKRIVSRLSSRFRVVFLCGRSVFFITLHSSYTYNALRVKAGQDNLFHHWSKRSQSNDTPQGLLKALFFVDLYRYYYYTHRYEYKTASPYG
jgi:arylsulfatase A-like enzyme